MQENSLGGARYFLMMMKDDYSHWRSLYFIKNKLETSQCLEDFFKKTDNHLKKRINIFRLDNSLEFVNKEIEELTCRYGITHQRTVPFTPEQNGSAENRTIVDLARTSLHTEKLLIKMWAEAVDYTAYTLNRTGTSAKKGVTPIELWLKKRPNILNLRTFGEKVYFHIPKEKRRKWDAKVEKGIFVGYDENIKGFRI